MSEKCRNTQIFNANRLGGLWDGETKHQAGSVWDINGLSPTIDTMLGGGREPHIVEVIKLREAVNTMPDGTCRTIKGQYHFSTIQNFESQASFGATGVVNVEKIDDVKILGGLEEGSSQRRKIYDTEKSCPTLQAAMGSGGGNVPMVTTVEAVIGGMQKNQMVGNGDYCSSLTASMGTGGGYVPMVVEKTELKELGYLEKGTGKHQSNIIYDKEGLSPCICAGIGVKQQPTMTIEQTCVAMRGRNPENPSDRTSGIELEQRLEPNTTGCTNTLTTVQKDNLVLEEQVVAYDEQNNTVRSETFGTLTTDGSSPKHNNRVIKIKQATKQGFIECEVGGVCCLEYPTSELRRGRVIENGQISPTLTTESIPNRIEFGNPDFYNFLYEIDGEIYLIRIRKLIPKECWRLMGFRDEDFEKAEKVNSNTQLYKQAGNSIVCNVLEAIFSQMNIQGIEPWNEKHKE